MYSIFRPELHEYGLSYLSNLREFLKGSMSADDLEQHQVARLREIVDFASSNSPFYRNRLNNINLPATSDGILSHLDVLPFTTKDDLRDAGIGICSRSVADSWIYYETTGTTGPSTPCPRHDYDSIVNNAYLTLRYEPIFNGSKHVVAIMGPTELHSTGDTFEDVFRSMGHTVIKMWPRSPLVGMERTFRLLRELSVTAIVCTPAVAADLIRYAINNGADLSSLNIRVVFLLGELISKTRQSTFQDEFKAEVYNCMYASQESSILAACDENDYLRTIPYNVCYEIINPETGERLDVSTAPICGELVISHLYKGSKPLIRYRTGDIVRVVSSDDAGWRIEPVGRYKDIIRIGGRQVYAHDLEETVFTHIPYCGEYNLSIECVNGLDQVTVTIETCRPLDDMEKLNRCAAAIEHAYGVKATVVIGNVGKIAGTAAMVSWKAARIRDLRVGDDLERAAAIALVSQR